MLGTLYSTGLHQGKASPLSNLTLKDGRRSAVLSLHLSLFSQNFQDEQDVVSGAFQACLLWSTGVDTRGPWPQAVF